MTIPEVGDTIDTACARELCTHYGLTELVSRIDSAPAAFKSWKFDGISMVPDRLFTLLTGRDITEVALRHDLKYAYGEPGNKSERLAADKTLRSELKQAGVWHWLAELMYRAVRIFGAEKFKRDYSWGFARV